jgi:hypothetical protein
MKIINIIILILPFSIIQAHTGIWISYADIDSTVVMISNDTEINGFQFVGLQKRLDKTVHI